MSQFELKPLLSGDRGAWEAFVDRYAGLIYSAVRRTVGRAAESGATIDARDVGQDVFVKLVAKDFAALRRFNPAKSSLPTYLTVIAHNVAVDHLRRARSRPATVPLTDPAAQEAPAPTTPASASPKPVELPAGVLTPRQEVVLRLLLDEGMSVSEVAETLGVEAQTIRSTRHKAITRMRQYVGASKS
jgi:RNA polymerase sigma factor (sigma-70 family)